MRPIFKMFEVTQPPLISSVDPFRLKGLRLVVFDFDGVFTDNSVWISDQGVEQVRCCRSDGLGLARLRDLGVPSVILSTETNPVVSVRAGKLNIPCSQAVEDKLSKLLRLCDEYGCDLSECAFVGNDINDIPALEVVGMAIVTADAFDEAKMYAHFQTSTPGGHGAVREICDLIHRAHVAANAN